MYVNRLQDMEAQLEDMREHERKSRSERDKEYYKQLDHKNSIEDEIEKSRQALAALRKSKTSKNVNSSGEKSDSVLDIGEMLDKLHQ